MFIVDRAIHQFDLLLRTFLTEQRTQARENPANEMPMPLLSPQETRHVAGLMRVNHAGEVCAQALYRGQAVTARLPVVKNQMQISADEEKDHLAWCEQRLQELNAKTSLFNPLWYIGSFMLGMIAGAVGDQWSLSFVAETERQVSAHLQRHLEQIPAQDLKTKALLTVMQADEAQHEAIARATGAVELPWLIQRVMHWSAKVMTTSSYIL